MSFLSRPTARPIPPHAGPSVYHRGVTMDQMTRRERFYWRLPRWVRWMLRWTPIFKGVRPLRTKIHFDRILQPKIKDQS